jgi:uncharacterized membrane protein
LRRSTCSSSNHNNTAPANLPPVPLVPHSIHLAICLAGGKLLRLPMQSVLIASNANVGGSATAAAMASAKGWTHLVQPAVLTGALGYAIATSIGLAMGHWMQGWHAF